MQSGKTSLDQIAMHPRIYLTLLAARACCYTYATCSQLKAPDPLPLSCSSVSRSPGTIRTVCISRVNPYQVHLLFKNFTWWASPIICQGLFVLVLNSSSKYSVICKLSHSSLASRSFMKPFKEVYTTGLGHNRPRSAFLDSWLQRLTSSFQSF